MGDAQFRAAQWDGRYAPHVAEINGLVDDLTARSKTGPAAYVAPHHGGSTARLVSVMSNPGPRSSIEEGSGFISCENDDATAERMCELYSEAGIDQSLTVLWNAHPWYVPDELQGSALSPAMRDAGVRPMKRFLDLLPDASIVILHGGDAQDTWRRFDKTYGHFILERGLSVRRTWLTSDRALATNRARRLTELTETYAWAAQRLGV